MIESFNTPKNKKKKKNKLSIKSKKLNMKKRKRRSSKIPISPRAQRLARRFLTKHTLKRPINRMPTLAVEMEEVPLEPKQIPNKSKHS